MHAYVLKLKPPIVYMASSGDGLVMRSIASWNVWGMPLLSQDLSVRMKQWRRFIDNNMPRRAQVNDNELVVCCIQEAWGFRSGLGVIGNWLAYMQSQCYQTHRLSRCLPKVGGHPIRSNDNELMSFVGTALGRAIPGLNALTWDPKWFIMNGTPKGIDRALRYGTNYGRKNKSMPSMVNCKSIFKLKPLLDSGSMIMANRRPTASGFKLWNTYGSAGSVEDMARKGIAWAYFESGGNGIMVFSVHLAGASPTGTDIDQLHQIVNFARDQRTRFSSQVNNYVTYVAGDFNIEFLSDNPNDRMKYEIMNSAFVRISNVSSGSTCRSNKVIDFVFTDDPNVGATVTQPCQETGLSDHYFLRVDRSTLW